MRLCLTLLVSLVFASPAMSAGKPRNIIVMIADGAGYNTLVATRYWKGAPLAVDTGPWFRASMATYALRRTTEPENAATPTVQDPSIVYVSAKAWNSHPVPGTSRIKDKYPALYAGYEWHRASAPDSANTMSAMMTGVRTYNGAINVDGAQKPLWSLAEAAKAAGKMTGSISSVPFNHATPAAGGGVHASSRDAYHRIAEDMFGSDTLDVIGGAGNPDFDDNGKPIMAGTQANDDSRFRWLPEALWLSLKAGTTDWHLLQSKADIVAFADGTKKTDRRLAFIAPAHSTLQANRSAPPNPDMPTLADMARAALKHVDRDADGFFMQIEGGAIDWAMHTNDIERMIEEYTAFDNAVRSVVTWIDSTDSTASWDDTLLIVTADHDHLLFGPDTKIPFQSPTNAGPGKVPGHSWAFDHHSNQLVPFFARGAGSDGLAALADEIDVHVDRDGRHFGYGRYLTQTEMGQFLLGLQAQP